MAKRRNVRGRDISGVFLLDKPKGISSNAALQTVKALYFAKKAGHTGSLDPIATGMLPICFGEATKFSQFLLDADKHYHVQAQLGVRTDSCDAEGKVVETKAVDVSEQQILACLENFRGDIKQVPSMFSALKHNGKPLYKLARQGIEIEREARPVSIHELELLTFENDTFSLNVKCSKGTYIRNLVDDIGQALGCGAHVVELRRLGVAGFTAGQMLTISQLEQMKQAEQFQAMDNLLLPITSTLQHLPVIHLPQIASFQLKQGSAVQISDAPTSGFMRLIDSDNNFIGIGTIDDEGKVAPRRLVSPIL
jgi:tRNA pseudouridine55 synthase